MTGIPVSRARGVGAVQSVGKDGDLDVVSIHLSEVAPLHAGSRSGRLDRWIVARLFVPDSAAALPDASVNVPLVGDRQTKIAWITLWEVSE